ncbi:hypothetical protein ACFX2I_022720 [Malus domestica]
MPGTSNGLQGATATPKEREYPASKTLSSMDKIWETLTTIGTSNHDQYLCREGTDELDYRSGRNSFQLHRHGKTDEPDELEYDNTFYLDSYLRI